MTKKHKNLGTIYDDGNVMNRKFNFLVIGSSGSILIHYQDMQGKGFKFYLIIQGSSTYFIYVFKQFYIAYLFILYETCRARPKILKSLYSIFLG